MTKRKTANAGQHSRLEIAQYRLRKLASDLEDGGPLQAEELRFLVAALQEIGQGADANVVLGVKAKRGERKTAPQIAKKDKMRIALGWVASAIQPENEGGLGLSLDDAIARAAEEREGEANFGLSEESLRTYWNASREWPSPTLPRPIATLPARKRKP